MEQILRAELSELPIAEVEWSKPRVYAQFVAQTYYYVCHSTRLLGAAAARVSVAHEKLHQRFLKHASEERSHHLLAERDLRALGFTLADFPELPSTAALYQTQYYRIDYVSPLSLLGYILALEGVAVTHGPAVHAAVRAAHGPDAAAFLRLHAEEDPDHLDKAFEVVRALAEPEVALVLHNLRFSCALYGSFLRAIASSP